MKQKILLPHRFKTIGWFILIPATLIGIYFLFTDFNGFHLDAKVFALYADKILGETHYFKIIKTDISRTLLAVVFIIGGLMVGFSKEKNEDEYIANLRLSSLLWAVLVNYLLLLFAFLFVYGLGFIDVMLYSMFTVLVIFIVRFNCLLYRNTKLSLNAE